MILKNIFNKKQQSIQLWMLLRMEQMLESSQATMGASDLLELPKPSDYYDETAPTDIQELISMGFKNSLEVRNYLESLETKKQLYQKEYDRISKHNELITSTNKELEQIVEKFRFLIEARKIYGENTILIPISAFMVLLKKYNLRCGTFEDFVGEIPKDQIQNIKRILEVKNHPKEVLELYPVTGIKYSIPTAKYYHAKFRLERFPFLRERYRNESSRRSSSNYTNYTLLDGECLTQMDGNRRFEIEITPKRTRFFIAAPKKYFKHDLSIKRFPKNEDPLICAVTTHGIISPVRWGEEASDSIIQAFDNFNRRLNSMNL